MLFIIKQLLLNQKTMKLRRTSLFYFVRITMITAFAVSDGQLVKLMFPLINIWCSLKVINYQIACG